jgi:hypothetical protein
MTTLTVFLINVHAHLIFLSIPISNKSAQIWAGPVPKISKKLTYCIGIHDLFGTELAMII